jgi:hypothetical protein
MATAYTPGLTVSPDTLIRRTRRLPLKGEVVARVGEAVAPETVVARALLPGILRTVKAAEILGLEPHELAPALRVQPGDAVTAGQVIGETRSFFGLFRSECRASASGTVELISPTTGHVGIREAPTPVEVSAYIRGIVAEVRLGEGVDVETRGALVQGIFGVGGERRGTLRMAVSDPGAPLEPESIQPEHRGQILVGGCHVTGAALRRAAEAGVVGIIAGAIVDQELIEFLGYDIGVAITGDEAIDLTLILTEGFGSIRMADRTFRVLCSLEGREASINGATQIRAGVIRPEVVVPASGVQAFRRSGVQGPATTGSPSSSPDPNARTPERLNAQGHRFAAVPPERLDIGSSIRIIREPYFGRLGRVAALPAEPRVVPSGAVVRVLEAELEAGERVIVPRANVEIIAE